MEKRLLSKPSDPTARVYIKFDSTSAAHSAVSKFDRQPADGNILQVSITNSALGSRMGVRNKTVDVSSDLLAPGESATGGCARWFPKSQLSINFNLRRMRSDELIKTDPRAKVIVDPSGVNAQLQPAPSNSTPAPRGQPRGRGGRGGGRGRVRGGLSTRSGKLSERMDMD